MHRILDPQGLCFFGHGKEEIWFGAKSRIEMSLEIRFI